MQWEEIIQNTNMYKEVVSNISSNMLSHAYICITPDVPYAQSFAGVLAKTILCETMQKCNHCRACHNMDAGVHADVLWFGQTSTIKPEDVSEIVSSLAVRPYEGERKVYILCGVDAASEEVQNKLLKSIEEPPAHVVFLLTASTESKVLPTILSRCHTLTLPPLSAATIASYCQEKGVSAQDAQTIAIGSLGYIGKAERIMQDATYLGFYKQIQNLFFTMNTSKDILAYATLLQNKEKLQEAISILEVLNRDAMLVAHGAENLCMHTYLLSSLQTLVQSYQKQMWSHLATCLQQAQQALAYNTSAVGVADTLLFAMVEVKYKWKKL